MLLTRFGPFIMGKLILGTVQFGLDYGISNDQGKPSKEQVHAILDKAYSEGIALLDTAEAYGNSEELIGQYLEENSDKHFNIATKFHLSNEDSVASKVRDALNRLSVNTLEVIMFHSYQDYLTNADSMEELIELKRQGLLKHIGVSVYTNKEIEHLLSVPEVSQVQVPFNVLDNESQRGSLLKRAHDAGKVVHTRSAFLQGLFFMNPDDIPEHLNDLKELLNKLKKLCVDNNLSMADLALSYVMNKPYIDGVLIGVNSADQLKENIKASSVVLQADLEKQIDVLMVENTDLLNPAKWKA